MFETPADPNAPSVFPAPASKAVTVTVTPPTALPKLPISDTQIALLAREVAMDFNELVTILAHFGLTEDQFVAIQENPFYQKVLEQERAAWHSASNTEQRLKLKALAILEEAMPELGARMMKPSEALPAVVETGKLMARVAGVGDKLNAPERGEKFSINIQIGETAAIKKDVQPKTIDALANE